ncbi:MAG: GlsB/YeaQ/YmgE family stress response membrane protein [Acuticoccus sp.]
MDINGVGWLTAIIVGGLAGWLAEKVMQSRISLIGNIIIGIVGAVVANFLFQLVGIEIGLGWFRFLIAGFVGSCVLIALARVVR